MILISPTEKQFIRDHLTDDVRQLVLSSHPAGIDVRRLAAQIAARQKARDKLPTWYASDDVVFPPALSVEQASSEQTAHYKTSLVSGKRLLDLTGGMGVDTWGFAQRVEQVVYVEQRPDLAELAAYNLTLLGAANVMVQVGNGLTVVDQLAQPADWIYLDPHRRDEQSGKVVRLADCEPDVSRAEVLAKLLDKADRILLKASPLIDLDSTIRQFAALSGTPGLGAVESIHVVAIHGEVKEVLFILSRQETSTDAIEIKAVNLLTDPVNRFSFQRADERTATVTLGDPQLYIYEPNAAVLKAGAFRLVGARFGLLKLAPNSHLYTSRDYKGDFPGRIFQLDQVIRPNPSELHPLVPSGKANLTVRNFPQSVAELRKKLKLKEGGHRYIFATTLLNSDKRLLITRKINQVATP
ncbi:MAG TPA: hypothetical protein VK364_11550 [Hymenobacter sp.]|nr:hypothetical protein [Hymenobacter sp.]